MAGTPKKGEKLSGGKKKTAASGAGKGVKEGVVGEEGRREEGFQVGLGYFGLLWLVLL